MSAEFAAFAFQYLAGPVFAASASVGVFAVVLVLISIFKDVYKAQEPKRQ